MKNNDYIKAISKAKNKVHSDQKAGKVFVQYKNELTACFCGCTEFKHPIKYSQYKADIHQVVCVNCNRIVSYSDKILVERLWNTRG